MATIEFEIQLDKRDARDEAGVYSVAIHWEDFKDKPRQLVLGKTRFDFNALKESVPHSDHYGMLLASGLFSDPKVLASYTDARQSAQGAYLRIRLAIDPKAPELHELRWETLRDPIEPHDSLTTREQLLFSRFLESGKDWWTGQPQARQDLRALVVVASPSDLKAYQPDNRRLGPIPIKEWVDSARSDLGEDIAVVVLGDEEPATLDDIITMLRCDIDEFHPGYDILYLVCHGALIGQDPRLYLEKVERKGDIKVRVVAGESGQEFAQKIGQLTQRPRLIVLCSCESAGPTGEHSGKDWGMLAALGPLLAAEGIPAVVAMQGMVPMDMVHQFLRTFFKQIQMCGIVDQAMAAARADVKAKYPSHYWRPTLYLRLKNGDIRWYTRGFMETDGFGSWPTIVSDIREQQCTPILGPGLLTPFYGSFHELARRFARHPDYRFPLASHLSDDLIQVAQYLSVTYKSLLRNELRRYLCQELIDRNKATIGDDLARDYHPKLKVPETLQARLMEAAWNGRRAKVENDAHEILARLPFPIYVSANSDSLMFHALKQSDSIGNKGAKKAPREESLEWWNDRETLITKAQKRPPEFEPRESTPLVYHIFGRLDDWAHVPVTEDDYFSFLLNFGEKCQLIPPDVLKSLAETSLLFLGFQLDDWSFRVLLHALRTIKTVRSYRGVRVAVQINPEPGQIQDAAGAHKYLEQYFQSKNIVVYWGSAEEFLGELWRHWN